jgi:hypothetical protein
VAAVRPGRLRGRRGADVARSAGGGELFCQRWFRARPTLRLVAVARSGRRLGRRPQHESQRRAGRAGAAAGNWMVVARLASDEASVADLGAWVWASLPIRSCPVCVVASTAMSCWLSWTSDQRQVMLFRCGRRSGPRQEMPPAPTRHMVRQTRMTRTWPATGPGCTSTPPPTLRADVAARSFPVQVDASPSTFDQAPIHTRPREVTIVGSRFRSTATGQRGCAAILDEQHQSAAMRGWRATCVVRGRVHRGLCAFSPARRGRAVRSGGAPTLPRRSRGGSAGPAPRVRVTTRVAEARRAAPA